MSDDGALRLNVFDGAEALPALLRVLDDAGVTMHSINLSRPTLDDVFLTMTGRSLRDDSPSAADQHRPEPGPPGRGGKQGVTDMTFIHDTLVVFRRQMRLSLRNPAWVIIALVQPVLYLVLFGPLLTKLPLNGSTSAAGTGGRRGVQVLRAWPADPARPVRLDVRRVRDHLGLAGRGHRAVPRDAGQPARDDEGRVLRDVVVLVVQAVILVLVAVAFGLRAPVTAVLISLGFIVVVAVGLASVSYATALLVKSEDAFAPHAQLGHLPLVLLSGIMLPLTLGPGWLQGIARISPFRYIIDAMRGAFYGHYANTIMLEGVLVAVGLAAVCLWLGSRVFVRENA